MESTSFGVENWLESCPCTVMAIDICSSAHCVLCRCFFIYRTRTVILPPALWADRQNSWHSACSNSHQASRNSRTRVSQKNDLNTMLYYFSSLAPIILLGRKDMNGSEYILALFSSTGTSPNPST